MEKLKDTLDLGNDLYGYYDSQKGFIPYYQEGCKKIDCIYCKVSKKVFAI